MSFASNLRKVMNDKEMSQKELCIAIGRNKSSVSQYLSGDRTPKLEIQQEIARALDCTVEFLNTGGDTEIEDVRKVSVSACAKKLGKSEQFIRMALRNGNAPFGFATKTGRGYSYHISPKKLAEYIGM